MLPHFCRHFQPLQPLIRPLSDISHEHGCRPFSMQLVEFQILCSFLLSPKIWSYQFRSSVTSPNNHPVIVFIICYGEADLFTCVGQWIHILSLSLSLSFFLDMNDPVGLYVAFFIFLFYLLLSDPCRIDSKNNLPNHSIFNSIICAQITFAPTFDCFVTDLDNLPLKKRKKKLDSFLHQTDMSNWFANVYRYCKLGLLPR